LNFWMTIHAQFSPDRKDFYLSILTNRIGRTYLTTRSKLYHQSLDRQIYDENSDSDFLHKENKTGFEFSLGQQIARFGMVNTGIEIEEIEYENVQIDTKNKFGLRIFKIQSLVETFNRIPLPESGKKHYFEIQFAGKFLGGDAEFTRFFSSIEAYFPIAKILTFHPKISIGISRSGLPFSEKFFIGGMRSLAGYHSGELSGDKVFLLNNELRIKLPYWFYFTGRYDLGDVYTHKDDIKLSNLRHGTCFILSLDSPIGPFELGYGFNNEDIDRVYFRAGLYF